MKTIGRTALLGALLLAFALTASCNSGDGGTGQLSVSLMDDPIKELGITQVWVTIDSISVHRATGGWVEVVPNDEVETPITVDLLQIRGGAADPLGLGFDNLPAGHYTQIRLKLLKNPSSPPYYNYVLVDQTVKPLRIPSGYQTGVKLYHPFDIEEDSLYELLLDFDAASSIHLTGSGKYMMRPTIRATKLDVAGIIGTVTAEDECMEPDGATVMAQVQDDPGEPTTVRIVRSAVTDEDDEFVLACLPPDTYNVVAYQDDPGNEQVGLGVETGVPVETEQTVTQNIELTCYDRQEVSGIVTVDPLPDPPEETVPLVTVFTTYPGDHDIIVTTVGAPWDGSEYSFSVGLPTGFTYTIESDLGTVTLD